MSEGVGPFHIGGRGALSYERPRDPFVWVGAGPFHIDGCRVLSYRRAWGPYMSTGVGPFHVCTGKYILITQHLTN